MYKRNAQGWSKHLDFIIMDEICLQIALIFATYIRLRQWPYTTQLGKIMAFALVLSDAVVLVLNNSMHNVLKRSFFRELYESFKHSLYVFAIVSIYMFATQTGVIYSRLMSFMVFGFHFIIGFIFRTVWKTISRNIRIGFGNFRSMLVVSTPELAEEILKRLSSDPHADYKIVGVVLTEKTDLKSIGGFPVVADIDGAADYIVREWIDSVYFESPLYGSEVVKLMDACSTMGIPTHYHVPYMSRQGVKRFSEKIAGTTVLTSSINYATPIQSLIKRAFDIVAGLFGSIFALLIMAIVGPIIKKQSPGPILFKQERIGKNGKHINIYKIRSMRLDADELKEKYMKENRVKDGMMFKLDFDPRIIGNKILEDGTHKTGIGEFIRKTSLDEFPQFFNVLAGSMSTVGTRPPTIDEFEKYKYHHRARMAVKPGITGLWQVSGRSQITDFEEVVKLDTEYIANWSFGLDIKILFKTIGVVFRHKGAM